MRKIVMIVAGVLLYCLPSAAQRFSLSTDLLGYACLGTINADASVSLSRKWSLTAGIKYNPFVFMKDDPEKQFQMKKVRGRTPASDFFHGLLQGTLFLWYTIGYSIRGVSSMEFIIISGMSGAMNVKNISDHDISGDIYVYYKYKTQKENT